MNRLLLVGVVASLIGGCALINAMKQEVKPPGRMVPNEVPEERRGGIWVGGTPLGVGLCGVGVGAAALVWLVRHHRRAGTLVVPAVKPVARPGELVDAGGVRNPWDAG